MRKEASTHGASGITDLAMQRREIDPVCGMKVNPEKPAATVEREDIPGWLALHLTPRALQAKAKRKAKAPAVEADDDQGQLSILDEVSDV